MCQGFFKYYTTELRTGWDVWLADAQDFILQFKFLTVVQNLGECL